MNTVSDSWRARIWLVASAGAVVLAAGACGDNVTVGMELAVGTGGAAAAAGSGPCALGECQGHTFQCGDCLDNDADGLVDSADPDCLGPCDNTEDSFYGGIPGQNSAPCKQDCYFDQDTGSGNDGCHWSHECDPLSTAPDYPPSGDDECRYDQNANVPSAESTCAELSVTQADDCLATCLPLTPNGCDCFGCCELPAGSGAHVWIGSTVSGAGSCDRDGLDNPTLCKPCTPVTGCYNPCDRCEVCVGRASPAADCTTGGAGGGGGASGQCPDGNRPCGLPGQAVCPGDAYCISGCCVALPR